VIGENAILLIAGEREDFEEVKSRAIPHPKDYPSRVIVCGYGTVGWSVIQTLREEGITSISSISNRKRACRRRRHH
jgi:hypothetical protein